MSKRSCLLALLVLLSPSLATAVDFDNRLAMLKSTAPERAVDAAELLRASDLARGGNIDGLSMASTVTSYRNGREEKSYGLAVEADGNNSLVVFTAPARSAGIKMLVKERNMWFLSPEVRKPVPISPRQRLIGEANNGDIATTNYSRDYEPTLVGEEVVRGVPCYVLSLKARDKNVTYDRIIYYIAKDSLLGLKAEYFTLSGKRFKTAQMEYGNRLNDGGQELHFISRMEIQDDLQPDQQTVLTYSEVRRESISPSRFNITLLMRQ